VRVKIADFKKMQGDRLAIIVQLIEYFVAGILVLLAALAMGTLAYAVWGLISTGVAHSSAAYVAVLDFTLLIFVIAELFKIALAYIRHDDVIPTVMEASLVAIARKVVVLDSHVSAMDLFLKCAAYGILLISVGLAWYLLGRTNAKLGKVPDSPISPVSPPPEG